MIGWETGLAQQLILVLLDWSLRWGLALGVLGCWLALRPPRRADVRYALCVAALFAGLMIPLTPRWSVAALPPEPLPAASDAIPVGEPIATTPAMAPIGESRPTGFAAAGTHHAVNISTSASLSSRTILAWGVVAAWLTGVVASTVRLAIGWRTLMRLRSGAERLAPSSLLDECRSRFAGLRPVELASHAAIGSPVTLGGHRPMIVVPASWGEWSESDRRAALLHELSHVARRDDWMKSLQELIRIPLFFHPLVHWLLARLDREREWLCDEAVVSLGSDRVAYARLLLEQARRPGRLLRQGLPFLERRTVAARIERLLEDPMLATLPPASRPRLALLGATFLAAAVGLATASLRSVEARVPEAIQDPGRSWTLNGRVLGPGGKPAAGVTVVAGVVGAKGLESQVLVSDERGEFQCRMPMQDSLLRVIAHKPGWPIVSRSQFFEEERHFDDMDIVFETEKPQPISATLKDDAGHPIVSARVRVVMGGLWAEIPQREGGMTYPMGYLYFPEPVLRGSPLDRLVETTTDDQGNVTFPAFPPNFGLKLQVIDQKGHHFLVRERNAPRPAGTLYRLQPRVAGDLNPMAKRIPLAPKPLEQILADQRFVAPKNGGPIELVTFAPGRIEGRLTTRLPGVNVGDVRVAYQGIHQDVKLPPNGNRSGETITDKGGRFVFDDMDEGPVNILIPSNTRNDIRPWTYRAVEVAPVLGETRQAEIELIRGVEVEGVVLAPKTGQPAAGASVGAYGPANPRSGSAIAYTRTDERGRFRFRLPPGENHVYVMDYLSGKPTLTVNLPADRDRIQLEPLVMTGVWVTKPPVRKLNSVDLKKYPVGDFGNAPLKPAKR